MAKSNPLDTINKLTAAINRGDLAGMLQYFHPDAVLVVQALAGQAGQMARGHLAIREAYAGFFSLKPKLERQSQQVIETADVAIHYSRWSLSATAPDGKKMERTATSTDVLRRESDGRWLVMIYNPYGTNILER